jgi:putative phosphoesterase
MRIGIVSDTHGHLGNTARAVEVLASLDVDCVLHCGDIGSPEIVPLFGHWPTHFVFGNCDHDEDALTETIELLEQTSHGAFGSIELDGCRIALVHGHDSRRFHDAVVSQEFRLVCYGHTHVPEHHYVGETLVLNPGALFRATPHTIAVVDLPSLDVRSIEVA